MREINFIWYSWSEKVYIDTVKCSKRPTRPPGNIAAESPNHLPAKRADQFQIYSLVALISNLASRTARKNAVRPSWLLRPRESGKRPVFVGRFARYKLDTNAVVLRDESCSSRVNARNAIEFNRDFY